MLVVPAFFLFLSWEQDDIFPRVENTTSGKKWTFQIGSSPDQVYSQLQELRTEKKFDAVVIQYRQPFSKPAEIQNFLGLYQCITLESKSGVVKRALIQFDQNKVSSIDVGGALLDSVAKWPQNTPDEVAIHVNEPIDKIYQKLLAIYQIPTYSDYQIILPDKSLEKPFDPDMANYNKWAFDFSENISPLKVGRSSVRLFFNNKKLVKIRLEYAENEVVN